MKIDLKTMCRGDGKGFVLVELRDVGAASTVALCVADEKGTVVPSGLYSYLENGLEDVEAPPETWYDEVRSWWCCTVPASRGVRAVAVIPLLETNAWMLAFSAVDDEGRVVAEADARIGAAALKWRSRVNYRLQSQTCRSIRDIDTRNVAGAAVSFTRVIEDGEHAIIRAHVGVPFFESSVFDCALLDGRGCVLNAEPLVLEDTCYRRSSTGEDWRALTLSVRTPLVQRLVTLRVVDEEGLFAPCFATLDECSFDSLLNSTREETMSAERDPRYDEWFKAHAATSSQLAAQSEETFPGAPVFSIVVPLYRTPIEYFRPMLQSVQRQSYGGWELILVNASPDDGRLAKELENVSDARVRVVNLEENRGIAENTNAGICMAQGDFVAFLDHDDVLAPNALFEYARVVCDDPLVDIVYCDEDRIDSVGVHHAPFFKPDFSPELLCAQNYITHFLAVRKSLIEEIGSLDAAFDGAQDYDLVLRATERSRSISHIPRVLYHWRMHEASTSMNSDSKSYAGEAGRAALEAHCRRCGWNAKVERTDLPFAYRVRHELVERPKVSILIPNKDKISLLSACVESIVEKTSYDNYEIVVIENNSVEPETFAYYDELQRRGKARVVVWPDAFNFSKIMNFGVQQCDGDYVLLLNNDTEVITPNYLETMLGYFQVKGVGIVGAKLLFPDDTVQHGGVVLGPYRSAGHLFASLPKDDLGYFCRAVLPQNLSAVTGACQLVPRSVFEAVGGYTEAFEVGLNDVDFCLKVREAGYRVVWTPDALLYHYEFSSRGRDREGAQAERAEREIALLRMRWPRYFETGDPYVGPNVSPDSLYFGLDRR